jgi:zinc protease
LSLLLSILVDGDACRLYRRLVEQQKLAIDVGGSWHEGFDPALVWLYFTLPEGADPDAVQPAIDAELARLVREGVSEEELKRAKNLVVVSFWKKLATIDGKAQLLGEYEVFHGDWSKLFDAPAQFERVTAEQVWAVARDVLDVSRRTVGVLLPESAEELETEPELEDA